MSHEVSLAEFEGPLTELRQQCSGGNGRARFEEFKLWLKKVSGLLKLVSTVTVSAVKKFVAVDNFKVGNAGITWMSDNFKTNFLGKIEKNVKGATLLAHRLEKSSLDKDIRDELGSDKEETTLAYLFELLSRQSDGKSGVLLTNSDANIFYVRDANGNFWAVNAIWNSMDRGWSLNAYSVTGPGGWLGGGRVFSRK